MNDLLKTGACSIVVGENHYQGYFPVKKNKLLKITKITDMHNEFKNLDIIRTIDNYSDYYSIPDKDSISIKSSDKFYQTLKELVKNEQMDIFYGNLQCFYIDYAGNKELLDTLCQLRDYRDFSFWKSYNVILHFTKNILDGLSYLHQKKICHLDVKPENIMVNTSTYQFKLIDFGFSSIEPFDDYLSKICGTPGYFPKYFKDEIVRGWLPKIEANDYDYDDPNEVPMRKNRELVYKIDSYCLGRVLYFLKYVYDDNMTLGCFYRKKKISIKLDNIIKSLIENDVHQRLTIQQCLDKYFI